MTNLATTLALVLVGVIPGISQDRLNVVTDDIISVVDQEINKEALVSNLNRGDAISMLTAAVTVESGFREDVEACKSAGDSGKSVGLGQVMQGTNWEGHTRQEICSDRKLQLKLALHVIDRCWEKSPKGDAALRCYTSGSAFKNSGAARAEYYFYTKLKSKIGNAPIELDPESQYFARINNEKIIVAKNP